MSGQARPGLKTRCRVGKGRRLLRVWQLRFAGTASAAIAERRAFRRGLPEAVLGMWLCWRRPRDSSHRHLALMQQIADLTGLQIQADLQAAFGPLAAIVAQISLVLPAGYLLLLSKFR